MKFNKNYGKWFINDVRRAISKYNMIPKGEKVAVALSGGKDSSLLLWLMEYLRRYSNLKFELYGIHVKSFVDNDSDGIKKYCQSLGIPYIETVMKLEVDDMDKSACYMCSRIKRGAIQSKLLENDIRRVCYGHHASDVAETFFMNLIQNKKLGSFSPVVAAPGSEMTIVRPMIYLDLDRVKKLVEVLNIPTFDGICRYGSCNVRGEYRELLPVIEKFLGAKNVPKRVVDSLENIDKTNIWEELIGRY